MAEATTIQGAPARRRSRGLSEKKLAFVMVSPSMLLILLVAAYPILYGIWLSLHEYSVRVAGLSRWAGLRNYTDALSNPEFWDAMVTTLIFTAVSVSLELVIGLAMAMAMHAAFRGQGLLRTVILIPWAILTVVTGLHVALDLRVAAGPGEHDPRRRHGVARAGAARPDRDHHRRRVEDGAVHGAADPRRPADDPG